MTKSTMPIIGWIADILGYVISGIYWCLEQIGIPNIGIAIILFTFVMYLLIDAAADKTTEILETQQHYDA